MSDRRRAMLDSKAKPPGGALYPLEPGSYGNDKLILTGTNYLDFTVSGSQTRQSQITPADENAVNIVYNVSGITRDPLFQLHTGDVVRFEVWDKTESNKWQTSYLALFKTDGTLISSGNLKQKTQLTTTKTIEEDCTISCLIVQYASNGSRITMRFAVYVNDVLYFGGE